MKAKFLAMAGLFLCSSLAFAEPTRMTNPNAVGFEGLGKGLMFSVFYDRVIDDNLAAGIGYGSATTNGFGVSSSATLLPIYVNYYFAKDQGSLYVTASATILTNSGDVNGTTSKSGDVTFNNSVALPTFGLGYENRSDAGFLVRIAAYGIFGKSFKPWAGLSLGYSF